MTIVLYAAAGIAGIYILYKLIRKIRDKIAARNVIRLSLNRRAGAAFKHPRASKISRQPCSYCRRKADRLSFYADGGRVVGVCDRCKQQAERRALPRL